MNIENWNFQEYQKEKKEYEKQKQAESTEHQKRGGAVI